MAAPIMLCDTAGMSNERWLECRMHGPKGDIPYTIGGSDRVDHYFEPKLTELTIYE